MSAMSLGSANKLSIVALVTATAYSLAWPSQPSASACPVLCTSAFPAAYRAYHVLVL